MKVYLIPLALVLITLVGCEKKPNVPDTGKTVDYYADQVNREELFEMDKQCKALVVTQSDFEYVYSKGDCRTIELAKKVIQEKRKNAKGPVPFKKVFDENGNKIVNN